MFLKGLKDAIVNCGNRGFDLDKTYIADVYVHENGAVLSKLLKKRFIRGRARYGSDQHVKSSLVKFILQEREKPFKSRVNDPLEWVRERMRLKIGGGESGASVAQKAFDGLRKYRRELKIWN